jgi:dephospho-CoA kinase
MLAVGLTGGIGSGKSAVADLLVARGAVLIDADRVAREVVAPGGPAYQPLVDRFGTGILAPDGTIDRKALAAVAFADDETRLELNGITHPAIGVAMIAARDAHEGTDDIVVLAIPLLTAAHRETVKLDKVVVVDCPTDIALERLLAQRGFDRADAEARIKAQISREERVKEADYVLDNSGDRAALEAQVATLWDWLGRAVAEKRAVGGAAGAGSVGGAAGAGGAGGAAGASGAGGRGTAGSVTPPG